MNIVAVAFFFFYAHLLVCALKLCLLDTGGAPEGTELLFTAVQ